MKRKSRITNVKCSLGEMHIGTPDVCREHQQRVAAEVKQEKPELTELAIELFAASLTSEQRKTLCTILYDDPLVDVSLLDSDGDPTGEEEQWTAWSLLELALEETNQ